VGIGRGYGKLLLFGEHAAVYGHPAIGLRLDEWLDVSYEACAEWSLPEVIPVQQRETLIAALWSVIGESMRPGRIEFGGDLPLGVGFGSSAAFCTALLMAIDGTRFSPVQSAEAPGELWLAAHRLEHVFHGKPSGVDTGLSLTPSPQALYPREDGLPISRPVTLPRGHLVVCAIPRSASTGELVAAVRRRMAVEPEETSRILESLGSIAEGVAHAADPKHLAACDLAALAFHADQAHRLLGELGVTNSDLDEAVEVLHDQGALGAKMSGAGGGGAFFGLFADPNTADSAATVMRTWIAEHSLEVDGRPVANVMRIGVR
jgi:mevalonate kinase